MKYLSKFFASYINILYTLNLLPSNMVKTMRETKKPEFPFSIEEFKSTKRFYPKIRNNYFLVKEGIVIEIPISEFYRATYGQRYKDAMRIINRYKKQKEDASIK